MSTKSVKSAERILNVLELLASLQHGIRVNELGRQLALPRSSTSALIATLLHKGYITEKDDGYHLASIYREFGWVGGQTTALLRIAQPVMHRLVDAIGESAFLGIPTNELEIRYIAKKVGHSPLRYDVDAEKLRPAYCTSIGQVILGGLSERELENYLESHPLQRFTPHTVTDPDTIKKAIARGRQQGYVTIADSHALGASGVAAPIKLADRIIASLAIIAPTARFEWERDKIIEGVVAATSQISQRISTYKEKDDDH